MWDAWYFYLSVQYIVFIWYTWYLLADINLVHQIDLINTTHLVDLQFLQIVSKEDGILDHWKVDRRGEQEGGTFQPPEPKYLERVVKV